MNNSKNTPTEKTENEARVKRLEREAAALRENLRRRKEQQRNKKEQQS